jgi:sulfoxide reductase heme-binding subunit YedZ
MTDPSTHIFWITSRAAGTAALVLASAGVLLGLCMGTNLIKGRGTDLRAAHETISLATLVAIAVHGVSLLFDSFVNFSITDIAIPFVSGYKGIWMAMGIVGGWSLAFLGLSYYFRAKIGQARWRRLHRFTALAWVLGIAHSLGMGTDAGQTWFLAMTGIVVIPAALLLVWRLSGGAAPRTRAQQAARASSELRPSTGEARSRAARSSA